MIRLGKHMLGLRYRYFGQRQQGRVLLFCHSEVHVLSWWFCKTHKVVTKIIVSYNHAPLPYSCSRPAYNSIQQAYNWSILTESRQKDWTRIVSIFLLLWNANLDLLWHLWDTNKFQLFICCSLCECWQNRASALHYMWPSASGLPPSQSPYTDIQTGNSSRFKTCRTYLTLLKE